MALEFGNDFHPACEPIAWVWREGDDSIKHRPIAIVDFVDVYLLHVHSISFVHWYNDMITILLTMLALLNVLLLATKWWAPARMFGPPILRERGLG